MAILLLNEWIWHDLSGENGVARQREAVGVLLKIVDGTDQLVVVAGSKFQEKLFRFLKSGRPEHRSMAAVIKSLMLDRARAIIVDGEDLAAIPPEMAEHCNPDDHYLVRALIAVPGSTLVTTDGALLAACVAGARNCVHRKDWLPSFLGETH